MKAEIISQTKAEFNLVCNLCQGNQFHRLFYREPYLRVRCQTCGLVTISEMPGAKALVDMYGDSYFSGETYLAYANDGPIIERNAQMRLRHIEQLAKVGRLLDVGCATGFFLGAARKRGWETVGVDLSPYASQYAREQLGLNVSTGTLFDLVEKPASFDVITLWDSIEHVPEPRALIERAAWLLKPHGLIVVSTGDIESLLSRALQSQWRLITYDHLYYFSPSTLRRCLALAGLSVEQCTRPGRWVNPQLVIHMATKSWTAKSLRHILLRFAALLPPLYLNFWDVMTVYARKV